MKNILLYALVPILFLGACNYNSNNNIVYDDPIPEYDSFTINTINVGELRQINVWTPPQYNNIEDSFSVLYMPDGGTNEDFPHVANTLSDLIQAGKIPPVILVGIPNTVRRRDLLGLTEVDSDKEIAKEFGGSEKFRAFIADELFPEINSRYRVNSEKGIIGESLAGLFIVETMVQRPDMFDFYIAIDPSLWWNNKYIVRTLENNYPNFEGKKLRFWFAGSSAEDIMENTNMLAQKLQSNAPEGVVWQYSPEPKEKHNTIFRATKIKALEWALGTRN